MDPMRVWREWALRQVVTMHNLAMRERWRENAFQAAIHGVDMGQEPDWDLGCGSSTTAASGYDAEFEALAKRRKRG